MAQRLAGRKTRRCSQALRARVAAGDAPRSFGQVGASAHLPCFPSPYSYEPPERDLYLRARVVGCCCRPGARGGAAQRDYHYGRRCRLLRHRLLWQRDRHAEPRCARRGRRALHPILQHGALLSDPRCPAHRPLPAPSRHRPHDGRLRDRRLSRRSEPSQRDDRRGAEARRLPHLRRRQMACHAGGHAEGARRSAQLAAATGLRPLLRHDPRRGQFLGPEFPRARQSAHHRGQRPRVSAVRGLLLHGRDQRPRREVYP